MDAAYLVTDLLLHRDVLGRIFFNVIGCAAFIVHHLQGACQTEGFGKGSAFSNFQGFFPKDIVKSGRSDAGQKLGKSTHIGIDTHSVVVIDEQ